MTVYLLGLMHPAALQQFVHEGGHQQGGRAIALLVKLATHFAWLQVEFDCVRTIEARLMDETCRGIDGPRGPYGDEEMSSLPSTG